MQKFEDTIISTQNHHYTQTVEQTDKVPCLCSSSMCWRAIKTILRGQAWECSNV